MLSLQACLIPLFPRLHCQLPGSPGLAFPREHTAPGIRSHSRSDLPNPCPYPTFGLASPMALQTSVPPERVGPLDSNPLGPQDPESSRCWVPCLVTRLVALPGEPWESPIPRRPRFGFPPAVVCPPHSLSSHGWSCDGLVAPGASLAVAQQGLTWTPPPAIASEPLCGLSSLSNKLTIFLLITTEARTILCPRLAIPAINSQIEIPHRSLSLYNTDDNCIISTLKVATGTLINQAPDQEQVRTPPSTWGL